MNFLNFTNFMNCMAFVKRALRFMRKVLMWFFIISVLCVVVTRFVPVWTTPLMYIRSFESITHGKMPHWEKTWVSLDKISPNAVQAVVASEDNLFLKHWGFSFNDISKALEHNDKGKRVRGGSTISQQTAKNVFLFPQRSYIRKGLEAYFTVLIEAVWGKKRIMEVYLNVIEMGDGVYGIEAAAQKYFHKSADKLTREEAARIAVCLPNPRVYSVAKPSKYIISRQNKIVRLMKLIPKTEFK